MSSTPIWKDVFDAALSNDLDSVKYFFEVKGDPVTITNADEKSVAHIAAEFGRLSVLKYILDKDAILLDVSDIYGNTVLHCAVVYGDLDVVKYLVDERGANIHQPNRLLPGNTVLHLAAQKGKFDVLEYFVKEKYFNVNLRNELGEPPLFSAAEKPYMRIIQYLIEECNADPTMLNLNRDNIFFKSARRGDITLPRYLLQSNFTYDLNWDLNWVNADGYTALNLASKHNKVGIVNFLIQRNASIFITDKLNRTPLHYGAAGGYFHLCKLLVENGASYDTEDINGHTPLQLAHDQKVRNFFFLNTLKHRNTERPRRSVPRLTSSAIYSAVSHGYDSSSKLLGYEWNSDANINSRGSLDNVLLFANSIITCIRDSIYHAAIHPCLLSPNELIQRRLNPVAIDAIDNVSAFEDH